MTIRCLDILSERARRYLARVGAVQEAAFASQAELASLLGREGLLPWPELIAFEENFGGLRFQEGDSEVKLGVLIMAGTEERLRAEPEDDRVAIGTDGDVDYYMDRAGQVLTCGPDRVLWSCASSAAMYIEHVAASRSFADWHPDPFHMTIGPPGREAASLLGLTLDEVGSDSHEAYWMSEKYTLFQRLQGDWYNTSCAHLNCRSLQEGAEAIHQLRAALPDLPIAIGGCHGSKREVYLPRETSDVPVMRDVERWSGIRGSIRIDGDEMFGKRTVLWLVPEGSGHWRMEQYEVVVDGQSVVEWSSFSPEEQVTRHYTGF